ncbi:Nucleotide-binding universal stress protein, UspA family [Roseivivax lentus]|uniref:Nucleotide-binding universal stress protein, UspA family n=1 Tax=Roseivivax lentus TaxID=633194 RepID=A0A1N7LP85_9RHOB|nr:universal stress protein [Roseivivax lentus]SIS75612.1 Nucleotide-binding universal stress protein, UspA family [Roseivivax lentus]
MKTLLCCLMNHETADAVLNCAVPLADRHGAHLIGLHTIEALLVYPGIAMHVPDATFAAFNASQNEEAEAIEAVFRRHTEGAAFTAEWRCLRAESTTAADRMIESAHAADLVIMPKEDRAIDRGDQVHAQTRVIRESGRPVLIVPPDFDGPPVGRSIVLGWSDTREAARAAHDMVALSDPGAEVCILRVDGNRDALHDHDAIDLATALARHGLKAETAHRHGHGADIARILMEHAREHGADLVVTGAYGHSRTYDFVIGAVTHGLLREAEMPVMFSA